MHSKSKKQSIIQNNPIVRKHCKNKKDSEDAMRRVRKRALSYNKQCTIRIRIYLNNHHHCYISSNSCLDHKHHPKLDGQAISLSQSDISKQELRLFNVLYDMNVPPSKKSTVVDTVRDDNRGTFLPKTKDHI